MKNEPVRILAAQPDIIAPRYWPKGEAKMMTRQERTDMSLAVRLAYHAGRVVTVASSGIFAAGLLAGAVITIGLLFGLAGL